MSVVLDASAVLALLLDEPGAEQVLDSLPDAHLSSVNLSEAIARLIAVAVPFEQALGEIARLQLTIVPFDAEQAGDTATLRHITRPYGLSLGDRACLSLGRKLGLPVLTTDQRMGESREILDMDIRMIR